MEYLDIYDENNNYLGYAEERKKAHNENLWHRHVSCWIMNEKGQILLQQRSLTKTKNPGMWSKTGGHVDKGETPNEAIKREVFEEIGLSVKDEDIFNFEIFKSKNPNEHYYSYGYIFFTNLKEEDYTLQKEEVEQVKYYLIEEIEKLKDDNNSNYTFYKWEQDSFNEQMNILKEYRDRLR